MRFPWAVGGIFVSATACHIIWAALAPGDSYPYGHQGVYVLSFLVASLAGFVLGSIAWRVVALRAVLLLFIGGAALFWLLVPDGWWATEPPGMMAPYE